MWNGISVFVKKQIWMHAALMKINVLILWIAYMYIGTFHPSSSLFCVVREYPHFHHLSWKMLQNPSENIIIHTIWSQVDFHSYPRHYFHKLYCKGFQALHSPHQTGLFTSIELNIKKPHKVPNFFPSGVFKTSMSTFKLTTHHITLH